MSMQEMTAVITRFQAATDALAALGARLGMGEGDTMAPEIRTALDDVLAASGVDGVDGPEPQQRAMMAGLVRTMFAQSADLLRGVGCKDVHSLARTWPVPFGFVTGRKA